MKGLLLFAGVLSTAFALGPINGAQIIWHPKGCSSQDNTIRLANPSASATSPSCIKNDFGFPGGSPAGGWQISGMPADLSFEVKQGPPSGTLCGTELILQVQEDGCYDLPNLGNVAWWDFCVTGASCSDSAVKRSPASGLLSDDKGEYLIAGTGDRIPVYRQSGPTVVSTRLRKRQQNTYDPPQSCVDETFACVALAGAGSLKATCINCVTGLGSGSRASANIDCRQSTSDCPVVFQQSTTVTDTVSFDISFGGKIGDTGKSGAEGSVNFGLGFSFSTSTTHGQTLGLNIPHGHIGFVQYQPPAVLGTVVSSQTLGQVCTGTQATKICGSAPGILATSSDDTNGQYSVVLTS